MIRTRDCLTEKQPKWGTSKWVSLPPNMYSNPTLTVINSDLLRVSESFLKPTGLTNLNHSHNPAEYWVECKKM
jgi:hypothetical protein